MTEREITIRNIHTGEQYVPMLCIREPGQKKVPCIGGDTANGIYTVETSIIDHDHATIVEYRGQPYPIDRFLSLLRPITLKFGFPSGEIYTLLSSIDSYYTPNSLRGIQESEELHPDPVIDSRGVLKSICNELKLDPVKARKRLRDSGMRAPYVDEKRIREVLGGK